MAVMLAVLHLQYHPRLQPLAAHCLQSRWLPPPVTPPPTFTRLRIVITSPLSGLRFCFTDVFSSTLALYSMFSRNNRTTRSPLATLPSS